jgi:D-amino peptidase
MIVWICTDMEGLAGVTTWDQCSHPDDLAADYLHGREQLTADANAAIAGCFDAGADEVRILDGHGRNGNKGFLRDRLDPRARIVWIAQRTPLRWEGLDEGVDAVAMVGQHAMVGTPDAFLDHTQSSKVICRYRLNGCEHGEIGQLALYAGALGVPLVFVSGDEAACHEARRLFAGIGTTPTKRGMAWERCEAYDTDAVRAGIRRDMAEALRGPRMGRPWQPARPVEVVVEWSWAGAADGPASAPGVRRHDPRTVSWMLTDPRDVYTWPSDAWSPQA